MNAIVIFGTIVGPINVRPVGEQNLKLAEYKIDGLPCQSWGQSADNVPPIGTQVMAAGSVKARERTAQSGKIFTDISVSISRFEPVGAAPVQRPQPQSAPAQTAAELDPLFGD